jgi:hypothetical protein
MWAWLVLMRHVSAPTRLPSELTHSGALREAIAPDCPQDFNTLIDIGIYRRCMSATTIATASTTPTTEYTIFWRRVNRFESHRITNPGTKPNR